MVVHAQKRDVPVQGARYLREPRTLRFPAEDIVPESKRHMLMRTALFQILTLELQGRFAVGSDQFVYWNAGDPARRLAPDVFVSTTVPDFVFESWKVWEHGAPHLAVEIVSPSDASEQEWHRKLQRYQEAGVQELVRFDPDGAPGRRLRVWDRVLGDLVERAVDHDQAACATLGLVWVIRQDAELGTTLRLAHDSGGQVLLPTVTEARAAEAVRRQQEQRLREEEQHLREEEQRLREEAERRVLDLERELRELRGK
jgi:hypothetical protein